ncbi:trypsin-like peptidase domain-containing protein [Candidatus Pelagibacter sp.]|nr:trypsin-like peptidase domain-containing protein [Candidatus Pelagibacter sp.]
MLKFLKITASILFFSFINTNLIAEEIFCLDNKGLILPLFEESNCSINTDIRIDEKEFMHIIEFSESERLAELNNFRENKLEIEKKQKEKLVNKSDVEIKKVEDDQKILDQKKISNLAKQQEEKRIARQKELETKKQKRLAEIEKQKKEREEKRIARQKELETKKQKRLAEIEKQKKEREEKRIARQKELEIKKKLQKEERIAKKKLEEKLRKEKLAKKNISDNVIVQPSNTVNNELKIIYFDKEIVKVELLPNINPSSGIDFEKLLDLNLDLTKNLLANNSNLILIIPKDIDSFSTVTSEDSMTSQMVSGIRQVPNPEFNRLQMEIRRAEREQKNALVRAEDGFRRSQCISCGLITQWGGIAIQSKWNGVAKDLQNKIVNLTNSYSTTPDYLEKEILRSYNYVVQNINVEKKAIYQIIEFKNNKYIEKNISIDENKKFKVAYNLDPQDKKYETLLNKYSDTNQVTNWQNKKIKNISFDKFSNLIDNQESFKEITGKKELYASLNFDYVEPKELSWWERLFSSSKKESKKTASLSNKSSSDYELKDVRFDSVVIVKTESGLGSGFFISNDEILTNYHVIENSSTISVIDKFGKRSSAVVIKKDLKRDLALLKTNTTGKPVTFYSGQLKQGEMVEALGHPKGRKFSLTKGWISAIRKESAGYGATNEKNVLFIQTDAAINHGNSGGPLFYKDKVVGVNTQGLSKDMSEGMNFAVHFSEVNQFLSD